MIRIFKRNKNKKKKQNNYKLNLKNLKKNCKIKNFIVIL